MSKRLYRSARQNVIAGVCGGLAEYFDIDVTVIRLLWVVSLFLWGTGVLLYIIAAIIIPKGENPEGTVVIDKDGKETFVYNDTPKSNAKNNSLLFVGAIMIIIGGLVFLDQFFPFRIILRQIRGFGWPVLLIAAGLIILVTSLRRRD